MHKQSLFGTKVKRKKGWFHLHTKSTLLCRDNSVKFIVYRTRNEDNLCLDSRSKYGHFVDHEKNNRKENQMSMVALQILNRVCLTLVISKK